MSDKRKTRYKNKKQKTMVQDTERGTSTVAGQTKGSLNERKKQVLVKQIQFDGGSSSSSTDCLCLCNLKTAVAAVIVR